MVTGVQQEKGEKKHGNWHKFHNENTWSSYLVMIKMEKKKEIKDIPSLQCTQKSVISAEHQQTWWNFLGLLNKRYWCKFILSYPF